MANRCSSTEANENCLSKRKDANMLFHQGDLTSWSKDISEKQLEAFLHYTKQKMKRLSKVRDKFIER